MISCGHLANEQLSSYLTLRTAGSTDDRRCSQDRARWPPRGEARQRRRSQDWRPRAMIRRLCLRADLRQLQADRQLRPPAIQRLRRRWAGQARHSHRPSCSSLRPGEKHLRRHSQLCSSDSPWRPEDQDTLLLSSEHDDDDHLDGLAAQSHLARHAAQGVLLLLLVAESDEAVALAEPGLVKNNLKTKFTVYNIK